MSLKLERQYQSTFSMSTTEPPPNSSNGSPFKSSCIALKLAFRRAISLIPNLRSTSLVTHRTPTMPNFYPINRLSLLNRRSISSDTLPLYVRSDVYNLESQSYQPDTRTGLGKTMLGLTLQTVLPLALTSSSGTSLTSLPIQLPTVAMVIAFAVFYMAMLLLNAYPRAANTLDKLASVVAMMGFFLMSIILLPSHFKWIGWLAFALCSLASIASFR